MFTTTVQAKIDFLNQHLPRGLEIAVSTTGYRTRWDVGVDDAGFDGVPLRGVPELEPALDAIYEVLAARSRNSVITEEQNLIYAVREKREFIEENPFHPKISFYQPCGNSGECLRSDGHNGNCVAEVDFSPND